MIATFGNLVLQYLLAVLASWRLERERNEREIAMLTVVMAELGEALVTLSVNSLASRISARSTTSSTRN